MPDVHCSVSSCTHYHQGDQCVAREIMVKSEGMSEASNQDDTLCQTFKRK
ncbi:MAG: DUF1540 domain-containing protein [Methylocystaceae bacterium]